MTPTNGVQFLFPTQGTTLHYNDNVQVQYTSGFADDPWLVAFCLSADGHVGKKASQSVGGGNNTATVKLGWPGSDTPCWFDLKPNSTAPTGSGANSDQWSYDVSQRAVATTVGLPASSAATATAMSAAGASGATPSTTAATSSPGETAGLSTGAQAGIGVGVAAAGICIGAVAVFVLVRRRRRRAARKAVAARIEKDERAGGGMSSGAYEVKHPGQGYRSVQGSASSVTEMDGGFFPVAQELHGVSGAHEMPTHAG